MILSTPRECQILQVKGSVPKDCPCHPFPMTRPGYQQCFWPTTYRSIDQKFQRLSPWAQLLCQGGSQNWANYMYHFVEGCNKGCRGTARWRDTHDEVQEAPECRSLCPLGVGVHHPPRVHVFTHLEAPQALHNCPRMEAPSCMQIQLITPLSADFPIWWVRMMGVEGWGF